MNLQSSYVLIRSRQQPTPRRLQLPVTIGAAANNDIIVNAAALDDCAYLLHEAQGRLVLYHQKSASALSAQSLDKFGLKLMGPVRGDARQAKSLGQSVRELLAREQCNASERRTFWRLLTLGGLPQSLRLATYASAAVAALVATFYQPKVVHPDLSGQPISLTFDAVYSEQIGASKSRFGYEKGMTLAVEAPATVKGKSSLLTFEAGGLNFGHELSVIIKDQEVFASVADAACSAKFCDLQVPIAAGLLEPGMNVITIAHRPEDSAYMIKNILVQVTPPLTDTELAQVERWFQVAQRAFDERDLVPENLLLCQTELGKANTLLSSRHLTTAKEEDLRNRAQALYTENSLAFATLTKDLWAKADIATKLEKFDEAERNFKILLRLYPDPEQTENQQANTKLAELKELRQ